MSGNRNAKTWHIKELDLDISRKLGSELYTGVVNPKVKPPNIVNELRGYQRQIDELKKFDWPDLVFCVPFGKDYYSVGFKLLVSSEKTFSGELETSFSYSPWFVVDRVVDSLFIAPEGDPFKLASLDTMVNSLQATNIASSLVEQARKYSKGCVKAVKITREVFDVVLKSYKGYIDDSERSALEHYCSLHISRAEKLMVDGAQDYFKKNFLGLLRSRMTEEVAKKMNWNY
jgi:hypothetical protein